MVRASALVAFLLAGCQTGSDVETCAIVDSHIGSNQALPQESLSARRCVLEWSKRLARSGAHASEVADAAVQECQAKVVEAQIRSTRDMRDKAVVAQVEASVERSFHHMATVAAMQAASPDCK